MKIIFIIYCIVGIWLLITYSNENEPADKPAQWFYRFGYAVATMLWPVYFIKVIKRYINKRE